MEEGESLCAHPEGGDVIAEEVVVEGDEVVGWFVGSGEGLWAGLVGVW